jgi:hypothetical protein
MSSSRAIRIPPPRTPIRRDRSTLLLRVGRWRKRARWVWRKLNAVPKAVRIVVIAATILAVFSATNLVYHVVRTNFRNFSCHLRDPSPLSFAKTESPFYDRGTEGSNPAPSSGESANPRSLSKSGVEARERRAPMAAADSLSAGLSARDESHIAFFDSVVAGNAEAALSALHVHLSARYRAANRCEPAKSAIRSFSGEGCRDLIPRER